MPSTPRDGSPVARRTRGARTRVQPRRRALPSPAVHSPCARRRHAHPDDPYGEEIISLMRRQQMERRCWRPTLTHLDPASRGARHDSVRWLLATSNRLRFSPETLHLSAFLLDRYLARRAEVVSTPLSNRWTLALAAGALRAAAKYEERRSLGKLTHVRHAITEHAPQAADTRHSC